MLRHQPPNCRALLATVPPVAEVRILVIPS
uniref:Uncharacterized protein n=1 Tax=Zea mays TaxID=4577 RepID=B6SGT2_MAIZE|nr:hypothetical protein [Zea mays]